MSVFFKSDWLIRRLKRDGTGTAGALFAVGEIAQNSGCHLVMYEWAEWQVRSDGCYIIPFKWKAPSKEAFEQCLRDIADFMQFTEIQEITGQEFETGRTDEFVGDVASLEFVLYVEELGEQNEQILSNANR